MIDLVARSSAASIQPEYNCNRVGKGSRLRRSTAADSCVPLCCCQRQAKRYQYWSVELRVAEATTT
jgi:hypothetical protein